MAGKIVKGIAAAVAAGICAYVAVQLVQALTAALGRVEEQTAEQEAEARRSFTRRVGAMREGVSRVQRQLHVPRVPIPKRPPTE